MELLVNPEILTSYIHKLSCGTVVCKHFARFQVYPNYRWDLILYAKGSELIDKSQSSAQDNFGSSIQVYDTQLTSSNT
jgi:hypothetical protein